MDKIAIISDIHGNLPALESVLADIEDRKIEEIFLWHQKRLGQERLDYLKNLPTTIDLQISRRHIRLFHSSNQGVHHRVFPYKAYKELVEMFKNTDFTGTDLSEPDVIGYGDIHLSYSLTLFSNHKTIFNTGSVGCPADEPTASYAVLEGYLDNKEKGPFSINIIRQPYDIELAIAQAVESGVPQLENHIVELRTAVYRGLQKE